VRGEQQDRIRRNWEGARRPCIAAQGEGWNWKVEEGLNRSEVSVKRERARREAIVVQGKGLQNREEAEEEGTWERTNAKCFTKIRGSLGEGNRGADGKAGESEGHSERKPTAGRSKTTASVTPNNGAELSCD